MDAGSIIYFWCTGRISLQEYLAQDEARNLLLQDGYNIDGSLDEMIVRLKERFFHKTEFPHEIGLFLGYPIEDVKGFRKFGGQWPQDVWLLEGL